MNDTAASEDSTGVQSHRECEEDRKIIKTAVKCTRTLRPMIESDSPALNVNTTVNDAPNLVSHREEDGRGI